MNAEDPGGYICMAVFKPRPDLLARQIRSIQSQQLEGWRCLIGIDGEDAETRVLVETTVGGDLRFDVHEFADNVGFYRNFERLLHEVPHDAGWVALADQDDDWFPEKLSRSVPLLSDAALVIGQAVVVTVDGVGGDLTRRRAVPLIAEFLDNQVTGSVAVFRRSLLELALPFPEPTDVAYHDHWLGVCALAADGLTVIDSPVQNYIQHGANVIGEERFSGMFTRIRRLADRAGGSPLGSLRYLRTHRWGWRVSMARALLASRWPLAEEDHRRVTAIARGRLSLRLIVETISVVARRQAPPARALGLLIGAGFFR